MLYSALLMGTRVVRGLAAPGVVTSTKTRRRRRKQKEGGLCWHADTGLQCHMLNTSIPYCRPMFHFLDCIIFNYVLREPTITSYMVLYTIKLTEIINTFNFITKFSLFFVLYIQPQGIEKFVLERISAGNSFFFNFFDCLIPKYISG